jgi:hypothetical protein
MIKNVNTLEEYKSMDKAAVLNRAGQIVSAAVTAVCEGMWLMMASPDMGSYLRRHNLLMPFITLLLYRHLLCRPEEVQVLLLVRISSITFRAELED